MSKEEVLEEIKKMKGKREKIDPYLLLKVLPTTVDELELSVRTANLLRHSGISTIGELIQKSEHALLSEGWGKKSIAEIKAILEGMGLRLNMNLENMQFESKEDSAKHEFVAIGFFDDRLRLVSLHRDGRFVFLDEFNSLGGLYIVTSETLTLKQAIDELETLINERDTNEEDLQDFFERYPKFILNDEYKEAYPKVLLEKKDHENLIPDFILEPYVKDFMCDVLDLKLPAAKVWVLKKNRPHFSSAVLEACGQLQEYARFFDEKENRERILENYGLSAYKPKLFVIIGRKGSVDPIIRRQIEGSIPNVSVLTYDDIIERMNQRIGMGR